MRYKILIVMLSITCVNVVSGECYICKSGQKFHVDPVMDWSAVVLHIQDESFFLPRGLAASGIRYTDGVTTFWGKGDNAFVMKNDIVVIDSCTLVDSNAGRPRPANEVSDRLRRFILNGFQFDIGDDPAQLFRTLGFPDKTDSASVLNGLVHPGDGMYLYHYPELEIGYYFERKPQTGFPVYFKVSGSRYNTKLEIGIGTPVTDVYNHLGTPLQVDQVTTSADTMQILWYGYPNDSVSNYVYLYLRKNIVTEIEWVYHIDRADKNK